MTSDYKSLSRRTDMAENPETKGAEPDVPKINLKQFKTISD